MAQNANAVITAAVGHIFTAPVGTQAPTAADVDAFTQAGGLSSLGSDGTTTVNWESVGHTARDELPVFGYEGGEVETRGTWQAATLKTVETEPASEYVTFNVHQFDNDMLELYYGTTNANTEAGTFSVAAGAGSSNGTERALCIVIVDGSTKIAFHAEKVSIRREDSIELAVDEFAYMPLRATILTNDGAEYLFSWVSADTGIGTSV